MALTNERPKEKISSVQLLIEIAGLLKELTDDPNALKQMAIDAYALPEAEEKKAEEARAKIAEYENLVAENKRVVQKTNDIRLEIDSQINFNNQKLAQIEADTNELNKKNKEMGKLSVELNNREQALNKRENDINDRQIKLDSDVAEFEKEKQRIADYEATLKAKASALKSLVGEV